MQKDKNDAVQWGYYYEEHEAEGQKPRKKNLVGNSTLIVRGSRCVYRRLSRLLVDVRTYIKNNMEL